MLQLSTEASKCDWRMVRSEDLACVVVTQLYDWAEWWAVVTSECMVLGHGLEQWETDWKLTTMSSHQTNTAWHYSHTTHHRQQIIVDFRALAGNMKMKILCLDMLAFILNKNFTFFQNHRNLEMSVVTQAGSGHHKYKVSSLIFSFSVDTQPWTDW